MLSICQRLQQLRSDQPIGLVAGQLCDTPLIPDVRRAAARSSSPRYRELIRGSKAKKRFSIPLGDDSNDCLGSGEAQNVLSEQLTTTAA
jgi:hypothetical protein